MKAADACDFLFTGAAILPGFLAWGGQPALAALAFVFLVVAGALAGIADPEAPHRSPGRRPDEGD